MEEEPRNELCGTLTVVRIDQANEIHRYGKAAMADHIASGRVALITGGMIMSEALAVGAPAVVFPQVDNLIPEARWFAERGAICDLGYDGGMDTCRVGREVGRLLSDRGAAGALSARGSRFIDGHGAARAASEILARLSGFAQVAAHPCATR